jgi:hypothetical protein
VDRPRGLAVEEVEAAADVDGHATSLLDPTAVEFRPNPSAGEAATSAEVVGQRRRRFAGTVANPPAASVRP